ncbi:hypothetical protein K7Y63_003801 [Serratia marcescens]
MDKFSEPEQFDAEVEIHGGEPFAVWSPAVNGSHVKKEQYFALLAELEAKDKRIAELEAVKADASQVFKEIGTELGCNPDNESIMMAIDELKATQMTGPLKDVLKRNIELEAKLDTPAITDVVAERQRQITREGWTPRHDDQYENNELAFAASCYAFHAAAASWDLEDEGTPYDSHPVPKAWPWHAEWWKPTNPRRDLVKAAAIILAEIERIDRAAGFTVEGDE